MEDNNNSIPQEEQKQDAINWKGIFDTLLANWKKLFLVGAAAFVVFAALILCVPNTYTTVVKLSPEYSRNQSGVGSLASLASTMGFDLSRVSSSDALSPILYPEIVQTTDFAVGLFCVQVSTKDGKFEGTFYNYLNFHQQKPFWEKAGHTLIDGIFSLVTKVIGHNENDSEKSGSVQIDKFFLSKRQKLTADKINRIIVCEADKKTGTITLKVHLQDPLVCGQIADSVRVHLEEFITQYHTTKALNDENYFRALMDSAKVEYDLACQKYFHYVDEHSGLSMERYKLEQRRIEDDMQLKYNVFSSFQKNYLAAQAKVQDCKPAFVIIQAPTVPTRKASPSRAKFTVIMTLLTLLATSCYLARDHFSLRNIIDSF